MNRFKQILKRYDVLLVMLFAGLFLPVSAQSQTEESLIATVKGHGKIISSVDPREITAALVVLRQNGTTLITVNADLQLQAEGTWKASAAAPDEILLKITGGAVKGELTGSGKLFLTSDRKSFKKLTLDLRSSDGQEITVIFAADTPDLLFKVDEPDISAYRSSRGDTSLLIRPDSEAWEYLMLQLMANKRQSCERGCYEFCNEYNNYQFSSSSSSFNSKCYPNQ